ncbi:DUF4129 domain-containing protein [Gramella sp. BOM4]|nr:DUF4129 domain-containing protein [Christiangramia bathymodioli]
MKNILFILILFISCGSLSAQESDTRSEVREVRFDQDSQLKPVEFNKEKIENYRSQPDYSYMQVEEKESWWSRFKKWLNAKYNQFISWLFGEYEPNSFLAFIISIIPYLVLFLLLGLVAWLFSRLNPGRRVLRTQKPSEVFISEEEELIKGDDLPALIKEAIKNQQYRLAVRYYYLNSLQKLDELELIDYTFQKTNKDYQLEIRNEALKRHFSEISKLYEFIWYGNFEVSETDFQLAEKGFSRMDAHLKSVRYE